MLFCKYTCTSVSCQRRRRIWLCPLQYLMAQWIWGPSRVCVQAGSAIYHVTNTNTRTWDCGNRVFDFNALWSFIDPFLNLVFFGPFWSFLVLFGLFWSFLILSGPFLSYLAQFATLWLNFSLNLFITHLFSLMPISLFFTKEILHQGECKQNLEYPVLCSHESSLRFSLYTCILTQWLLLGMFVQKLLDTNLNFRYQ